jgi:hypothetical protein
MSIFCVDLMWKDPLSYIFQLINFKGLNKPLHAFLNPSFIPRERTPGGWLNSRVSLDAVMKRNHATVRKSNPGHPASHYTGSFLSSLKVVLSYKILAGDVHSLWLLLLFF